MPHTFFGERWDSPAFDGAEEIPTPVGAECLLCHELFMQGDSGTTMNHVPQDGHLHDRPVHLECYLMAVLGSPAHLRGECSCAGGSTDHLADERPYRVQAREVLEILRAGEAYWDRAG